MNTPNYHHGDLRCALLKAAEAELEQRGIERFSLRAVAKRAGVSHAAPAHHFKDLRGLLTALAASGYERMVEFQQQRRQAAPADARARFVATGMGYIDFALAHPDLFRLMFSSEQPDRAEARFETASMAAFDQLVTDVRATGHDDPYTDSESMKQLLRSWAVVHGLAELIISGRTDRLLALPGLEDREAVLASLLESLLPDASPAGAG